MENKKQYFMVIEKVTQNYYYEVRAENKGEAERLVREGRAGQANKTAQGETRYEVYG